MSIITISLDQRLFNTNWYVHSSGVICKETSLMKCTIYPNDNSEYFTLSELVSLKPSDVVSFKIEMYSNLMFPNVKEETLEDIIVSSDASLQSAILICDDFTEVFN